MDKNFSAIIIIAVICITIVRIARIVVACISYRALDPKLRDKLIMELDRREKENSDNDKTEE